MDAAERHPPNSPGRPRASCSQAFELAVGSPERRLRGRVTAGEPGASPRPVVVLAHGYLASMDWGFLPPLERALAAAGLAVVSFDFTGNGVSGRRAGRLDDEPGFARNTYAQELEDLAAVTAHVRREGRGLGLDASRLGLFGHSRGAAMSLVHASEHGAVSALCSWSAGGHVGRYDPHRLVEWERNGYLEIALGHGRKWRLERDLWHDFTNNAARYDLRAAALRYAGAWMIVQGERDRATTPEELRRFLTGLGTRRPAPPELHFIAGAGHNFGARRSDELRAPLTEALELTAAFFVRELLDA